jgi:hypothetical protein
LLSSGFVTSASLVYSSAEISSADLIGSGGISGSTSVPISLDIDRSGRLISSQLIIGGTEVQKSLTLVNSDPLTATTLDTSSSIIPSTYVTNSDDLFVTSASLVDSSTGISSTDLIGSGVISGSPSVSISLDIEPSGRLISSQLISGATAVRDSLQLVDSALLTTSAIGSSCSIFPSEYFGSSAAIRSPTRTEKAFQWVGPGADAGAAQDSGAVGSGAIAGGVIGTAAVVGVAGALVFLFLLRRKREKVVDVGAEQEDHELSQSFGSLGEWSDIISEGNGISCDMEESFTFYKYS